MGFHKWPDFSQWESARKGTWRRVASTEGMTVTRCEVKPDARYDGSLHRHSEEQAIVMLEGRLRLRVGEEERWMEPGDLAFIPANAYHGGLGVGPDGAVYLEIFAPGRMDYLPGFVGPRKTEFREF